MRKKFFITLTTVFCFHLLSAQDESKVTIVMRDSVELDKDFTNLILPNNNIGISGADGCISIDLGKGKSLFLWGDSFLGKIEDNQRKEPSKFILGNTATLFQSPQSQYLYNGSFDNPKSFIEVDSTESDTYWYWPGDGIVKKNNILLFMAKYRKNYAEKGPFAFIYAGCDYLVLDKENFTIISRQTFIAEDNPIHYGHAVVQDNKYLYIYGSKADNKNFKSELHVMRVQVDSNNLLKAATYWDGRSWNKDPKYSRKIEGIKSMVSEQFSIRIVNGKVILFNQDRFQNPGTIYSYIADRLEGPFRKERLVYQIDEPDLESDSLFTYNAMFHPQIIRKNKILASYNVNTYSESLWWKKASVYRPRFLWVPISYFQD